MVVLKAFLQRRPCTAGRSGAKRPDPPSQITRGRGGQLPEEHLDELNLARADALLTKPVDQFSQALI